MGNAETLPENAYYYTLCYIFELITISTNILIISQITSSKLCGYNKVNLIFIQRLSFSEVHWSPSLNKEKTLYLFLSCNKMSLFWLIPIFLLFNWHISISYLRILFITKILEQSFLNHNTISNLHYLIKPPVYF